MNFNNFLHTIDILYETYDDLNITYVLPIRIEEKTGSEVLLLKFQF